MGPMQLFVGGCSLTFETQGSWDVGEGWDDAGLHDLHGVYLEAASAAVMLHLTVLSINRCLQTADGLVALLREQVWGSAPFDIAVESDECRLSVAGTFVVDGERVVREWFVTGGRSLVNAAMVGSKDDVDAWTSAGAQLLATLEITPPSAFGSPEGNQQKAGL